MNQYLNLTQLSTNHFDNHFTTVADKLLHAFLTGTSNYCDYLNSASAQSIYVWSTCPSKIANMQQKMKNKLNAGIDQLPTTVLKAIANNIRIALSHVINLSLSKRKFVSTFKLTKVCPVYKKGNPADVNNYKLISQLSSPNYLKRCMKVCTCF